MSVSANESAAEQGTLCDTYLKQCRKFFGNILLIRQSYCLNGAKKGKHHGGKHRKTAIKQDLVS